MNCETNELSTRIRNGQLQNELIPLHALPDLIPSSRKGKKLSLQTIYRWILQGRLKSLRIGGSRYVTPASLAAFIGILPSTDSEHEPSAGASAAGDELDQILNPSKRRRRTA